MVQLTSLEIVQTHRIVWDNALDHLVDVDDIRIPVVRVAFERDVVLLHPFDKHEGPGTDRMTAGVGSVLLQGSG